jgi:protoporphyrin/coproporphyrin ferrochelatase
VRDDVVIVFSAHSLPLDVIDRGDAYPAEIGASVHEVMQRLGYGHEYLISYQSDVGPVRWLGPSTESVLKELGKKKRQHVLVVGIAFTSDHIETLHELDIEYGELAHEAGITHFHRAPALNGMPAFQDALADLVATHLASGEACTRTTASAAPAASTRSAATCCNPVAPYRRTAVTPSPKNRLYPSR